MAAAKTTHSNAGVSVESCRGFNHASLIGTGYIAEDVDVIIVPAKK